MDKIKFYVYKVVLNKFALGYLVKGWNFLKGYKTQIFSVICVGIKLGEMAGKIPHEMAVELLGVFGGAASVTFMQKLARYECFMRETLEATQEAAANADKEDPCAQDPKV